MKRVTETILPLLGAAVILSAAFRRGAEAAGIHITAADLLLCISAILIAGAYLFSDRKKELRLPAPAVLLFLIAGVVSTLFSHNPKRALLEVIQYTGLLGVAWITLDYSLRKKWKWVVYACTVLFVFITAAALIQVFGDSGRSAAETGGILQNRMVYGAYLVLLFPPLLGYFLQRSIFFKIAAAATLLTTLLTVTSGWILLCLLIGAVSTPMILRDRAGTAMVSAAAVLFFVLLPVLPGDRPAVFKASVYPLQKNGAPAQQYLEWIAGARGTLNNLYTGTGPGTYQEHIGRYYGTLPKNNINALEPDTNNTYAVLGLSMGLPGLLCFLALLFGGFRHSAAAALCPAASAPAPLRGWFAGSAGSLFASLFLCLFTVPLVRGTGILLVLLFAAADFSTHFFPKETLDHEEKQKPA